MFSLAIFFFNSAHINQQLSYENIFLPAAENLISNLSYNYPDLDYVKNYPLWGYSIILMPGVLIGKPNVLILLVQFALTLLIFKGLFKEFALIKSKKNLFLTLPITALMSVKWPDAIVLFLVFYLVVSIYKYNSTKKVKYLIYGALYIGIAYNFRSEFLILLPLMFLGLLLIKKLDRKYFFLMLSYLLILPWGIRNQIETSEFSLSASNGGAVAYISLGQLPNNEWGIKPFDPTAYKIADSLGFKSPYTNDADRYFKSLFWDEVTKKPIEFFKKLAFNSIRFFSGGVYTGEYANLFLDDSRLEIDAVLNSAEGLDKIEALVIYGERTLFLISSEKAVQLAFRFIFIILMLRLIRFIFIKKGDLSPLHIIIFMVLVHKLILVSFIQYEVRHINIIYPFILIISSWLTDSKNQKV